MATTKRYLRPDQYRVGWICALPQELAAAQAMLDERYESILTLEHDTNHYTFGRVKKHNVVIASLPAGNYGTTSAATVASQMLTSFTSIKIKLMVGIGGGVPTADSDIRLGDVVISQPQGKFGGVVQYDRGKKTAGRVFERTGQLDKPPQLLLNALNAMRAEFEREDLDLGQYLRENLKKQPRILKDYDHPHVRDVLYQADYCHVGASPECDNCQGTRIVHRPNRRSAMDVRFHYGTIASGNSVLKDGIERDNISKELGGILCFEMEAAGLMDHFSCLVIRGICDYADSHKNKGWQRYAALTAAAYAKQLLSIMPASEQLPERQPGNPLQEVSPKYTEISAQQRSLTPSQWTSGPGQPIGPPFPGQWISELGLPIEQPWSPPLSHLAFELGQPVEQQIGLPSGQTCTGFLEPTDHYQSTSSYHQRSTQPKASTFNRSALGYNHSASQYRAPSSDQLHQGVGRPSAYPNSAIVQRSLEGVPSTQPLRPPLAPNRIGHSDSDIAKSTGVSEPSGGMYKSAAVTSQPGGNQGYTQPCDMIYPQYPGPSHPNRTYQRSQGLGHSTPPIPPLPLSQPRPEHPHSKASGEPYTTSRGQESKAVGPSGSGDSRSFDASHKGQSNATAPYLGSTKYSDKAQPERSHIQALQAPEKDRKMPSHTKDPKLNSCKENSHGPIRKPLAQSRGQQGHPEEPKSSTSGGGQERSHHDGPRPSQKYSAPKEHAKGSKSSTSDSQKQKHHHEPTPSSNHSTSQGPARETKSTKEHGKDSPHPDNEAAHPDHGSVTYICNNEVPSSTTNYIFLTEPNDIGDDTEIEIGSRISIDSEINRDPGDIEVDQAYYNQNVQVNIAYNQNHLAYDQRSPPYGQERSSYELEYSPYRQEPMSSGPGNFSVDQQLSTFPGDHKADNDIDPHFGGFAAEYLANQAMNATTSDHQTDDDRGPMDDDSGYCPKGNDSRDVESTHQEPIQKIREPYNEEEGCGCCYGGGDKGSDDGGCCGWMCCGGGSNDPDDEGCCSGMWNCCDDKDRSDDGEKNGYCIVM